MYLQALAKSALEKWIELPSLCSRVQNFPLLYYTRCLP